MYFIYVKTAMITGELNGVKKMSVWKNMGRDFYSFQGELCVWLCMYVCVGCHVSS